MSQFNQEFLPDDEQDPSRSGSPDKNDNRLGKRPEAQPGQNHQGLERPGDQIIDDESLLPRIISADGPKALAEARQANLVMNNGQENKVLDQSQKKEQDELARLKKTRFIKT